MPAYCDYIVGELRRAQLKGLSPDGDSMAHAGQCDWCRQVAEDLRRSTNRSVPCWACGASARRGAWDPDGEGFLPVCETHAEECKFSSDELLPIPYWYQERV